jgi:hypothetical protein
MDILPVVGRRLKFSAAAIRAGALLLAEATAALGVWNSAVNAQNTVTFPLPNGDTVTATVTSPTTATAVAGGPVPFVGDLTLVGRTTNSLTFTGPVTSGSASAQVVNCTVTFPPAAAFSGQCGPFTVTGTNPMAVNTAVKGAASGSTRAQVQSTVALLNNRFQSILRDLGSSGETALQSEWQTGTLSGISAGSEDRLWTLWFSGSPSWLRNYSPIAASAGYSVNGFSGIHYNYENTWFVGFDAGYIRTDVNGPLVGNFTSNGAQLGPYFTYILNQNLSLSGSFSYTRSDNDTGGDNGLGAITNSSYSANRYTGTLGLNAAGAWNDVRLSGTLGYVYSLQLPTSSAPASFGGVPAVVHYGALTVGGQADYPMGRFDPYIPLGFNYQTTQSHDGTGRAGVTVGLGVRYTFGDGVQASFQITTEQGRLNSQNITGIANLAFAF